MFKKEIFLFAIFLIILVGISFRVANAESRAGFIQGNIWFSQEPLEEGARVKIYTMIFNPENKDLSGSILFFDNTTLLGQKDFSVTAGGLKDISINWTVNIGAHTIFARIQNAKFLLSNGEYEDVDLKESISEKNIQVVKQKIIPKTEEKNNAISEEENKVITPDSVQNLANLIQEKIPPFVAKPLLVVANQAEEIRNNLSEATENKKLEVKEEIQILNETKPKTELTLDQEIDKELSKSKENQSGEEVAKKVEKNISEQIQKPLKYVGLFFLSLASYVFKTGIIFYGLALVIFILIIRFIWRKIF